MKKEHKSKEELNQELTGSSIHFSSKEELAKHIQMNMPLAVKPTKKAKTVFVNPFTSNNARKICIDCVVDSLLNKQ